MPETHDLFTEAHEPAFPAAPGAVFTGMSLRDWFAGLAMAGQIFNLGGVPADVAAKRAYKYADAMCQQRDERLSGGEPMNDDTNPIEVE